MPKQLFLPALLLVVLSPTYTANAQWSPSATLDLGMGYGQMALSQAALEGARRLSEDSEETFAAGTTPPKAEISFDPSFASDPRISETVNQRFVLFYAGDDAENQEIMASKVASGEYQQHFRALMQEHGLEPRLDDLVEVSTTRYVLLWEIVNGEVMGRSQALGLRAQVAAQFSDDFWMKRMDDAEKQELAETFVLHVAAADLAHQELLQGDDQELLAAYRAGVQRYLLPDGPRMERLVPTDAGFKRRPQ